MLANSRKPTISLWEAMYRTMVIKFLEAEGSTVTTSLIVQSLENIKGETESEFRLKFNTALSGLMKKIPLFNQQFDAFIQKMSNLDDVWKLWSQFVFKDAMAYILPYAVVTGTCAQEV